MVIPKVAMAVAVDPGADRDTDTLARLSQQLRLELADLDVDTVRFAAGGAAPEGAKSVELLDVGGLVVVLGLRRHVLRAVVDTVAAWLARQQARSVKLTLDGDELEVTGLSSTEQKQLMARWVERHALPG
ncbi:MAG: hypothetical protein QOJ63_1313 [Solirubrobacteraceae bacterium]|nr:hypothetical protein [Solirubrobacteraceae bacterium]